MLKTNCKVTVKDGSKKLVTEYELALGPLTLAMDDPNVKRMINETMEQFKMDPDAEAPSIVIKTTTLIQ